MESNIYFKYTLHLIPFQRIQPSELHPILSFSVSARCQTHWLTFGEKVSWFKVPLAQHLEVHRADGFNLKDISGNRQRQSCPLVLKEIGHWPGDIFSSGIFFPSYSFKKSICCWTLAPRKGKINVTGVSVAYLNISVLVHLAEHGPIDNTWSDLERQQEGLFV